MGPGDDESAATFLSDVSGNPVEFIYPTNTRISFTVKVNPEEPRLVIQLKKIVSGNIWGSFGAKPRANFWGC